ncbi:MAG TPA: copper resistance system multicopper oxidase [Moraxellaceae bacterium]|nr:copper resistance system multicopper oxidase [Moraxellaceae bacterium]
MPIRPTPSDKRRGWGDQSVTRRQFVQGLALGSAALSLGLHRGARAATPSLVSAPGVLSGSEFQLDIGTGRANFTGRERAVIAVNGSLPAPVLRFREGDDIAITVRNALADTTSIHWHGVLVPAAMDGVPGLSFAGIRPGETFTYRFPVRQAGTYWYHSHSGMQELQGLYGAIVIDPREPEPFAFDREHVVLLSDWTDDDPMRVFTNLRKQSDYYNLHQRTVGDFFHDVREKGWKSAWADRSMWGGMRMNPTDLADVTSPAFTCLVNGQSPAANWTGLFQPGEKVRLRFINGAAMVFFDVRIPGLKMTVVAADGQYVEPVDVDEFRLGGGETLDVIVEPENRPAYTIFAQNSDRTGYARATLAQQPGLVADVPTLDPRPVLTETDMGMDMAMMTSMPDMPLQTHPASERNNPGVDMQAMMPAARLDDPGVGLRDNGRVVLTYAALKSAFPDPDGREPTREIELHLTGNMERYVWSIDGIPFNLATPVRLTYGERVRLTLVNDTMMAHPFHLHGMWSDLEDEDGNFQLRKHTITIPPGTRRSYRVTADAPGRWAYHCHLFLHMAGGMMREVRVEGGA